MKHKLFVYGTLKKGHHNHHFLKGCEFVGNFTTTKDYQLYVGYLPTLIKEPNKTGCKGEVYLVDSTVLERIDALEGHPAFYYRDVIYVLDADGAPSTAWGYLRSAMYKGHASAVAEVEYL